LTDRLNAKSAVICGAFYIDAREKAARMITMRAALFYKASDLKLH
jgi:hypothetical protein